MIDNTQAINKAGAGINQSLTYERGAVRGSIMMPGSSLYIIPLDPARGYTLAVR